MYNKFGHAKRQRRHPPPFPSTSSSPFPPHPFRPCPPTCPKNLNSRKRAFSHFHKYGRTLIIEMRGRVKNHDYKCLGQWKRKGLWIKERQIKQKNIGKGTWEKGCGKRQSSGWKRRGSGKWKKVKKLSQMVRKQKHQKEIPVCEHLNIPTWKISRTEIIAIALSPLLYQSYGNQLTHSMFNDYVTLNSSRNNLSAAARATPRNGSNTFKRKIACHNLAANTDRRQCTATKSRIIIGPISTQRHVWPHCRIR